MNNYKYVTLLTSDVYVRGVLLLKETLRQVKSKYSLLCLITDNLSKETLSILNKNKVETRLVDTISTPENIYEHNKKINPYLANTWKDTFTKFHIWELTEYSKIIFLDADILILKNLDHCFEYENMSACQDGEYFNLWPKETFFNSGFFVIKPSKKIFKDLIKFINNFNPSSKTNYKGEQIIAADQDILNYYFDYWKTSKNLHLSKYYNVLAPYLLEEKEAEIWEKAYFVHFIGEKPWDIDRSKYVGYEKNYPKISTYFYIRAMGILEYLYTNDFKEIDWNNLDVVDNIDLKSAQLAISLFNKPEDVKKFYIDPDFNKSQEVKEFILPLLTYMYKNSDSYGRKLYIDISKISSRNDTETILTYYNMIESKIKDYLKEF